MENSKNVKSWRGMSRKEKVTRIISMYSEGYNYREIGEYYGVTSDAIEKTLKRSENPTNPTKRSLEAIDLNPVVYSDFSKKSEIAESIEELKETQYKYFLYDSTGTKLIKKAEYVEDLLEKINVNWVKERFESGYSELKYKDYIIRNSFKESFDTSKESSLDCNAAIKSGFSALLQFCKDEDFSALEKSLRDILTRFE